MEKERSNTSCSCPSRAILASFQVNQTNVSSYCHIISVILMFLSQVRLTFEGALSAKSTVNSSAAHVYPSWFKTSRAFSVLRAAFRDGSHFSLLVGSGWGWGRSPSVFSQGLEDSEHQKHLSLRNKTLSQFWLLKLAWQVR